LRLKAAIDQAPRWADAAEVARREADRLAPKPADRPKPLDLDIARYLDR
jgi:hypothetical protein